MLYPHTHAAGKKNEKNSEKAALGTTFMERYLFGDDPDEKRFFKKNQKNPNHSRKFWKDTCLETITGRKKICKKVQKKSPTGAIFGKILVRKRGLFLVNHKKILKKVHFFQPLSFFSGRYLVTAKKGINNISHARKEKNGNNGKKSDHFRIFVEDTCTKPPDGNVNNNAQ